MFFIVMKDLKLVFFCLLFLVSKMYSQRLHHQSLSAQGKNSVLFNGFRVNQSIGQTSVIGNYTTPNVLVGQGFIQSKSGIFMSSVDKPNLDIKVFPNPFISEINFKFSSDVSSPVTLSWFDVLGRLVYTTEKTPINLLITITDLHLPAGLYVVKLTGTNLNYTTQILSTK